MRNEEENPEAILTGRETATGEGATLTGGEIAPAEGVTLEGGWLPAEEEAVMEGAESPGVEEVRDPRENVDHWEDHTFENNVTIAGTLRTKRWIHPHGAMFQTPGKLLREYPSPTRGMWAIVGSEFPGTIWYCEEDGEWKSQGVVVASSVDRGTWKSGETYYAGDLNGDGVYEVSYVWYRGCKYRCLRSGTTEAPLWDSEDWEFVEGDPDLHLSWTESESVVMERDPRIRLEVRATLYNQDVTGAPRMKWRWERESRRGGVKDTASDSLWNSAHSDAGHSVDLRMDDMNFQFGVKPEELLYRVTATLLDVSGQRALDRSGNGIEESMEFEI